MNIKTALEQLPLIAILRGLDLAHIKDVGAVLTEAGFTLIEVTMNSPEPLAAIEILAKNYSQTALIGAGTVTSAPQVGAIKKAGGQFIISPNMDANVIQETKEQGMISFPGVFTPTESFKALAYGADGLKFFPAEAISPQIVKAYRAVLPPKTPVFIVGGVDAGNMKAYLAAGANGFGIGSSLVAPGKSLGDIRKDATELVAAYRSAVRSLPDA